MLDIKTLEGWLWEAACKIRGEIDAPKYKDYILPLIFLKRLSDVYDDEVNKLAESYEDRKEAEDFIEADSKIEQEENKKQALEELFKSMLSNLMTAKIRGKDIEVKNGNNSLIPSNSMGLNLSNSTSLELKVIK